jgi:hypothetical protein
MEERRAVTNTALATALASELEDHQLILVSFYELQTSLTKPIIRTQADISKLIRLFVHLPRNKPEVRSCI